MIKIIKWLIGSEIEVEELIYVGFEMVVDG